MSQPLIISNMSKNQRVFKAYLEEWEYVLLKGEPLSVELLQRLNHKYGNLYFKHFRSGLFYFTKSDPVIGIGKEGKLLYTIEAHLHPAGDQHIICPQAQTSKLFTLGSEMFFVSMIESFADHVHDIVVDQDDPEDWIEATRPREFVAELEGWEESLVRKPNLTEYEEFLLNRKYAKLDFLDYEKNYWMRTHDVSKWKFLPGIGWVIKATGVGTCCEKGFYAMAGEVLSIMVVYTHKQGIISDNVKVVYDEHTYAHVPSDLGKITGNGYFAP